MNNGEGAAGEAVTCSSGGPFRGPCQSYLWIIKAPSKHKITRIAGGLSAGLQIPGRPHADVKPTSFLYLLSKLPCLSLLLLCL